MQLNVKVLNQEIKENYALYNADSVEVLKALPGESIGYMIYSPPFSDLFCYSNSDRDLGNCNDYENFFNHYDFMIQEHYRILKKGRLVSIHCMNLPTSKQYHGYIGLQDFRGDIIRAFQKHGFIYHSEVCIWKDPLLAATRSHVLGLAHKQIIKDSSMCRQGTPDYIVTMRKDGDNEDFIDHETGFQFYEYAGSEEPQVKGVKRSHLIWQKYASPVWTDIRQTYTLQKESAREENDEKHICPLQLDTIQRCLTLWSKENDIVMSPFMGIGSEGYMSVKMKRRFIGCELKASYYNQAVLNIAKADEIRIEDERSLFDE